MKNEKIDGPTFYKLMNGEIPESEYTDVPAASVIEASEDVSPAEETITAQTEDPAPADADVTETADTQESSEE